MLEANVCSKHSRPSGSGNTVEAGGTNCQCRALPVKVGVNDNHYAIMYSGNSAAYPAGHRWALSQPSCQRVGSAVQQLPCRHSRP